MTTNTVTERRHRFVRTSALKLKITRLLRFALGTRQDALVLFIVLRFGHLHRILLLSNLPLRLTIWSIGPHLSGRQRLEIFGLHCFEQIWVVFDIEEHTEEPMPVPRTKQWVFPRWLLYITLGLGLIQ